MLQIFSHTEWRQCELLVSYLATKFAQWYISMAFMEAYEYLYSASGHMVEASDFICSIYMHNRHVFPWKIYHVWHVYEIWYTYFFLAHHNAPFYKSFEERKHIEMYCFEWL